MEHKMELFLFQIQNKRRFPMIWFYVVVIGICTGLAVYLGFKATEMPQEEKEKKSFYINTLGWY
jgi:hypothetical protein